MVTKRECELCKAGLIEKVEAYNTAAVLALKNSEKAIKNRIRDAEGMTAIFISILGLLLYFRVI